MSDGVSGEISARIRDGSFSKYMVIPVNIEGHFLAQNVGVIAFYSIFNFIAAVVWIFVFKINFVFTKDISMILSAVIICILGLIFMIELNFFLGILTLKFQDIGLFLMIKNNIIAFITGSIIPLTLVPNAILQVMRFFPFYYVTYLPSMLLIGKNSDEALLGITTLALWLIAFKVINRVTYNRLRVRYDGVGI
jgi:ABC-2 type transport system permease protein